MNLGVQGKIQHAQPSDTIVTYSIQPLASIYSNKRFLYMQLHVCLAIHSHIYSYVLHIFTQEVYTTALNVR